MTVYMYLRKSRSDDREEPVEVTLARHHKILTELAAKERLYIKKIYQEVISGESIVARPQMMALLEAVENGECDAVLCMDIDRLGRGGMKDQGIILETFKYSGTLIITPDRTYDLQNDIDEQLTEFKTFLSRQEYKIINKRLQRGIMETVKSGAFIASAPFGYKKAVINKLPSLEVVPEEAEIVRQMFDWYVNERVGAHIIAERFNAMGVQPRRVSMGFARTTINRMLSNPIYIGKVVRNKVTRRKGLNGKSATKYVPESDWKIFDGLHEPIIDEATFSAAQDIRKRGHLPRYNTGECKSPLAGLIICGKCGRKMQLQPCRGRWYYLRCVTKTCSGSATYSEVESAILQHLTEELRRIQFDKRPAITTDTVDAGMAATQKELSALQKQREKLMTFLEQGVYSIADYQERSAALNAKISASEGYLKDLSAERDGILSLNSNELEYRLSTVLSQYDGSDIPQQNALLKSVIDRVIYYRDQGRNQNFNLDVILRATF